MLKGCKPAVFVDYKYRYRNAWLPSTRSWTKNSFDLQNWEPVKTVLTYDNSVVASELYLYLLTARTQQEGQQN